MIAHPTGSIDIAGEVDIVAVRKAIRQIAKELGFSLTDITRIVTAASELTRNIYKYAKRGTMRWETLRVLDKVGLKLTFVDDGPGIPDIAKAMEPGFTTRGGLGMGLPGSKRLMDEMVLESEVGRGTTVSVTKWVW